MIQRLNRQTKFGKQGNCLAACISTLMGLSLEEVPNVETLFDIDDSRSSFQDETPPLWGVVLDAFISSKGFVWREATKDEVENPPLNKVFLCIGKSLDGSTNHAVLYKNGSLFFDPNPYRKGLSKILSYQVIEKI